MKKYTTPLLLITTLTLLGATNPANMSGPSIVLVVVFMCFVVIHISRRIVGLVRKSSATDDQKLSNSITGFVTGAVVLLFVFFLNMTGTLSMRDVVLAVLLGLSFSFYLTRRLSKA